MTPIVFCLGWLLTACGAKQDPEEKRTNMESYSLGYQMGQSLKNQKLDVDLDVYLSGVRDALGGNQSRFTPIEMRTALSQVAKRLQAAARGEAAAKAEKNLIEGKSFLEKNKKTEGVTVLPSGLQYKVLKQGTGKMPTASDTVTVNYRGAFTNGTEFVNTAKQGKVVSAGLNRVIPGGREAIQLMREGSRWLLFVPPELAYGQRGATGIEPNSTLVFEVELLSVTPALARSH